MPDVDTRAVMMDALGIPHVLVSPDTATRSGGIQRINNVSVAYPRSRCLRNLARSILCGLPTFHYELTRHMLLQTQTDNSRVDGTIHAAETSINRRLRFGYGRRQRVPLSYDTWKVEPCVLNGHQLPTMKYLPFTELPTNLQSELIKVFNGGTQICGRTTPTFFSK